MSEKQRSLDVPPVEVKKRDKPLNVAQIVNKNVEKKRGRGRPPKEEVEQRQAEQAAVKENLQFEMDAEAREKRAYINELVTKIKQMQVRLNAVGTGMQPTAQTPVIDLERELDLLNSEVYQRRSGQKAKMMVVGVVAPAIEDSAEKLVGSGFLSREQLDLRGLSKEVDNNWEEVFEEAAEQFLINNPSWLSGGPVADIVMGMGMCMRSVNKKNEMRRKREADEQAELAPEQYEFGNEEQ